ncbi:MAG: immunoglobulin domain-containing protein [Verrucomicrobiales bacterium]|nr:immunoglobulin domain-containing protein [Verrucomicrobiales bacterium]
MYNAERWQRKWIWLGLVMVCALRSSFVQAACDACTTIGSGRTQGTITLNSLSEASGIAASRLNPGVVWIVNDGSRPIVYAFNRDAERLASFEYSQKLDDTEDIAVGPGPVAGLSYLYVGDVGGNQGTDVARSRVKILRIPEPAVDLAWASKPRSPSFKDAELFVLVYPDGFYDAETLMVDPISGDVFIATKQQMGSRLYRANLTGLTNGSSATLQFAGTVLFNQASGGDISADGRQIVLRREELAMSWGRCLDQSVGETLALPGQLIPVIGPPTEPNGEGIALLPDGTGYVTVSEGRNPALYYFPAQCPAPPRFTVSPTNQVAFVGGSATLVSSAVGYPVPTYQWSFSGQNLSRETNAQLQLSDLSPDRAGEYQIVASNASGAITNTAMLTLRSKPDLRITEAMSSLAPSPNVPTADWWELTSFESQPVDLSGWRFNENSGALTDAFVLPSGLVILPGESVVFCEELTPVQFRSWWGNSALSATLQIVTYTGSGLSLGASGDSIRLWDAQATDPADLVASVDFEMATAGFSFIYDPSREEFGFLSAAGVHGAIQAELTSDVASPGRIRALPTPPVLQVSGMNGTVRLEFDAIAGFRYSLLTRSRLDVPDWELTGDTLQPSSNARVGFEKDASGDYHFYTVLVE